MKLLVKFLNLIVYSNLFIAIGALAVTLQTKYLWSGHYSMDAISYFIFASTLSLYAFHRLVGIDKTKTLEDKGRFLVIINYRNHILAYGIIALLISAYFFLQLKMLTQIVILLPSIFSIAYVAPIFGNGRRLRDLPFLKLFIIAFSWSILTTIVPSLEWYGMIDYTTIMMALERFFFLLLITLPFDIRDHFIDIRSNIKTISNIFGIRSAKIIAILFGLLYFYFAWQNYETYAVYSLHTVYAHSICFIITCLLIIGASPKRHDYFYALLMDGLLILQFGFILIFNG